MSSGAVVLALLVVSALASCSIDNICDCSASLSISGVSISKSACDFPGISSLQTARNDLLTQVNTLNSRITGIQKDIDTIAEIIRQLGNLATVASNIHTFGEDFATFVRDYVSRYGPPIARFSDALANFTRVTMEGVVKDSSQILPGLANGDLLLESAGSIIDWLVGPFLSAQSGVWKENVADCYYRQLGNISFSFTGIDTTPGAGVGLTFSDVDMMECLLLKKEQFKAELGKKFTIFGENELMKMNRRMVDALQTLSKEISAVSSSWPQPSPDDPLCKWTPQNIPYILNLSDTAPDWAKAFSSSLNQLNRFDLIYDVLNSVKNTFCTQTGNPLHIRDFGKDIANLLVLTEAHIPETIAKKLFSGLSIIYKSLATLSDADPTFGCLSKEWRGGNVSVYLGVQLEMSLLQGKLPISLVTSLGCKSKTCMECLSGINLSKKRGVLASSQSIATLYYDKGLEATEIAKCDTTFEYQCLPSKGNWSNIYCTCLCFADNEIFTAQYGCFDKASFLNGSAPPGGDPTINPYNPDYIAAKDPANPKNPNSPDYPNSGKQGLPSFVLLFVCLAGLLGRKSVFVVLLVLSLSLTPVKADVCSSSSVCVSLGILGGSACLPGGLNPCTYWPEVQALQDSVNSLNTQITGLQSQVTTLESQFATAAGTFKNIPTTAINLKNLLNSADFMNIERVFTAISVSLKNFNNIIPFTKEGGLKRAVSGVQPEIIDDILKWVVNTALKSTTCPSCMKEVFDNGDASFNVMFSTAPSVGFQISFQTSNALLCFSQLTPQIIEDLANKSPSLLESWWATKQQILSEIEEARSSVVPAISDFLAHDLCSYKPSTASTPSTDPLLSALQPIIDITVAGGPLAEVVKEMVAISCKASDGLSVLNDFFTQLEAFVDHLNPPDVKDYVIKVMMHIITKTSYEINTFISRDFSACPNPSLDYCSILSVLPINNVQCLQEHLSSTMGVTISLVFESYPTFSISLDGCSVPCMQCTGVLGNFKEFYQVLFTNLLNLDLSDFNPFGCPNSSLNCGVGSFNSTKCSCDCPTGYIASPTGCVQCPGNGNCSGNGKCYLDVSSQARCCCSTNSQKADCS